MFRPFVFLVISFVAGSLSTLSQVQALSLSSTQQFVQEQPRPQPGQSGSKTDVATMDACLALARSRSADDLWASEPLAQANALPDNAVADMLEAQPARVKLKLGFGVLYLCSRIVEVWHDDVLAEPEDPAGDEALVVDLSVLEGQSRSGKHLKTSDPIGKSDEFSRGSIDARALVRLTASDNLLPKAAYGGLHLRHADIQGTIAFRHAKVAFPLSFLDVRLLGENDMALHVDDASFGGDITISKSLICGRIAIYEAQFAKGIELSDVVQGHAQCDRLAPAAAGASRPVSLRLEATTIGQNLKTIRSTLGGLILTRNDIKDFQSSRTSFSEQLWIVENRIASVQMECSVLPPTFDVSYNKIERDLFIRGSMSPLPMDCASSWQERDRSGRNPVSHIQIIDNSIGGGLGLLDFDGARIARNIELRGNQVGAGSEVELPSVPWHGQVDLGGSVFDGSLRIGISGTPNDRSAAGDGWTQQLHRLAYCPRLNGASPDNEALIRLQVTRVRALTWDVPLTCAFRWSGAGLDFKLWQPGAAIRPSLAGFDEDATAAFLTWRKTMAYYNRASLEAMSTYLAANGSYKGSREILLDAKRLNYAPGCAPDSSAFACAAQTLVSGTGGGWLTQAIEGVRSAAMITLLWPVGYGAQPERAIVLLLGGAVFFSAVYAGYSRWLKWDLMQVPTYLLRLHQLKRTSRTAEMAFLRKYKKEPPTAPKPRDDETDSAAGDGHTIDPVDALIKTWPTRAVWRKMDLQDRLDTIKEDLLPEIARCEVDIIAGGPARIKRLRRRLERFAIKRVRHRLERYGSDEVLGFGRFHKDDIRDRFNHWRYSLDNMIPIIDLHARNRFYPMSDTMRAMSFIQYLCGWWWLSLFSYFTSSALL